MGVKVRQRPKGSGIWWVFIDHEGQRKAKKCGSEKLANEVKEIMEANLKLGRPLMGEEQKTSPTLAQYYRTFRESYLDTAVRETTRESYENSFKNHILPALGNLRLDGITRMKVKALVGKLVKKGLARPTIRIITAELCSVLNHALEDGLINQNPARKLSKFYKQA